MIVANQDEGGLRFSLGEGVEAFSQMRRIAPGAANPLSATETEAVLSRIQPLKTEAADAQEFALREGSLPPPQTGETVKGEFPPADQKAPPEATEATGGPLEVVRFAPEGEVPLAPNISITFSKAVVPVTSHQELAKLPPPARIQPDIPGQWRWVGAKTAIFEATAERFPMATEFTVEVPVTVRGVQGETLAKPVRWTFKTPPPKVEAMLPQGGPVVRQPLIGLTFDQKIDPKAVLPTLHLESEGESFAFVQASAEEVAADQAMNSVMTGAQPGRWLVVKPQEPLPADALVSVIVGPGTPSAEGPLKSVEAQKFDFQTYGPLEVSENFCGWRGEDCPPMTPWTIRFTNPLAVQGFDASKLKITPELPGLKASISGDQLSIQGLSAGRTTYKVQLDPGLQDVFGQSLGKSETLSFKVGSAPPMISAPGGPFVVTDPSGAPRYSLYTINHKSLRVSLYSVGPKDWAAYLRYLKALSYNPDQAGVPPGKSLGTRNVEVQGEPDQLAETSIDLSPALKDGLGHVIVSIEPPPDFWKMLGLERNNYQRTIAWVQATQIGLDAAVDSEALLGWATSLKDGKPLEGVELAIAPNGAKAATGADGLATIPLPDLNASEMNVLVATRGADVAILPENTSWWNESGGWRKVTPTASLRWFVFDDRQMYKPGEQVHLKGWVRQVDGSKKAELSLPSGMKELVWSLYDSQGNEVAKGRAPLSETGGFDAVFDLPPTMNLGYTRVDLQVQTALNNGTYNHNFQVQEFRRPEYEVSASASEGPHVVGGAVDFTVRAAYFAGGGLPGAEASWQVSSSPGSFSPPNWGEFTFGVWTPWWSGPGDYFGGRYHPVQTSSQSYAGKTDATGQHRLRVDLLEVDPPRATTLQAQAMVMDVNRQAWSASASALVHPAEYYVGLRSERTFVQAGQPLVIESIVTDLDGKSIPGRPIQLHLSRQDWAFENGEWKTIEADAQSQTVTSEAAATKTQFASKQGGVYKLRADITDAKGRKNSSELTLWVAGGKLPPKRNVERENAQLIPDRKDYKPGDTAEILVQSPFAPAEGLLTLRRGGILSQQRFTMEQSTTTLKVPLTEDHLPSLGLQVDLVGAAGRTDDEGQLDPNLPPRPAFAVGNLSLPVSLASRTLTVAVQPKAAAVEPGAQTEVTIELKDAGGQPVANAEVALVVVDEAILALSGFRLPSLLDTFYVAAASGVTEYHLRSNVQLANPEELAAQAQSAAAPASRGRMSKNGAISLSAVPAPMAEGAFLEEGLMAGAAPGGGGGSQPAIQVRSNFNPLAAFVPAVKTDAAGRVTVPVKLPDNLTRYRVMAVAVSGPKHFGQAESTITARLPLMVRPSAPRFLNFGDRFELPVVVQNQTDVPITVDVAVRASGVELLEGAGRRTMVPPNDRVEVRFPTTTLQAGTARFQIGAVSGKWSDAAELSLPVWTPATTEAFATYGELDGGTKETPAVMVQGVQTPGEVFIQFGGLEVTTSSTNLQALTDAVLYLVAYPFECAEQLSSRILAVAALKDVLTAFEAEGLPSPEEMVAAVKRDIERLRLLQGPDGGFSFWRQGDPAWPWISIHVAHALQRAKDKGFEVPPEMLQRSLNYLTYVETYIPSWYSEEAKRTLRAYALSVLRRLGNPDPAKAKALLQEVPLEKWPLEALGWLLPVLEGDKAAQEAILRHLDNRVSETAAAAHFVTSYADDDYLLLNSDRRTDGVLLEALIEVKPDSDLIPKLVRGLLDHRTKGRWGNTQENAFILLALDRYFNTFEKETPDFVARVWLGQGFAGEHAFKGRTTERFHLEIPMKAVAEGAGTKDLVVSKDGPGRLYYRLGMKYAPRDLKLPPADHGFVVQRRYEAVEDPSDVRQDADGTWRIKAGASVRVRLSMVAQSRRTHVALVDPLPAGLEAMNPALAVTGAIPQDPQEQKSRGAYWWWSSTWYEHQNLRDERVEAFASLLWEGVYDYTYVARATTPGTFVVPPPKAEEMYHPETFGRGASDRVIVE